MFCVSLGMIVLFVGFSPSFDMLRTGREIGWKEHPRINHKMTYSVSINQQCRGHFLYEPLLVTHLNLIFPFVSLSRLISAQW